MNLSIGRPIQGGVLTRNRFGCDKRRGTGAIDYSTVHKLLCGHNGLDYAAPEGTPILAAVDGVVELRAFDPTGYGLHLKVNSGQAETLYAHCSAVLVANGEHVKLGAVIARVGSTGNSTGPHLHFGLRVKGMTNPAYLDWVDPVPFRDI